MSGQRASCPICEVLGLVALAACASYRERGVLPYPVAIAAASSQAIVLSGGVDRKGESWRDAWRWSP
jgi:hypothetical protein